MGGTKLFTNKSHRDGSPSRRNSADVLKKSVDCETVHVQDKHITSELMKTSAAKKSGGTPMKMLLAQEMSKEIDSKRKQTNVVAKLMGLDEALPPHQSISNGAGNLERSNRSSQDTYRDVYEIWQQPPKASHFKDEPFLYDEIQNEMRMALVRQKFAEAKRLATNEKLLQSKEFQDAVEVLSSNRDLFLKFLDEPKSLFSKHLKELHSTPAVPQTKRIIILKPSKAVESKGDANLKKYRYSNTQPTRIVVLKPSPGKHHNTKPVILDKDDSYQVVESSESKDITSIRRDESLLSSVLSNGYVGDESSFNRSEYDYRGVEDGNFSYSSPVSRHSWEYSNRFGSPYSFSSFGRASCSPEPAMIREAKKRLSERWSLVASNEKSREQTEIRSSSSTLAEMLVIPEVKNEEDLRVQSASLSTCKTEDGDGGERSPLSLLRSKSVPTSSSSYENIGLNMEVPGPQVKKADVVTDVSKSKRGRLSFKGKVSSLFFSRNKKGGKGIDTSTPVMDPKDNLQACSDELNAKENDDLLQPVHNSLPECFSPVNSEEIASSSASMKETLKQGTLSFSEILSLERPDKSESDPTSSNNIGENQNQPNPTSVLNAPFENDTSNITPNSSETSNAAHSLTLVVDSVAHTLSWESLSLDTSKLESNIEEQQRLLFVHNIFSTAGLDNKKLNTIFSKWHSVDSPLDPSLLDKFLDPKEENAKSRERRPNQRLLFDCVNSALFEIGRTAFVGARKSKPLADTYIGDEVLLLIRNWLESGEIDNSLVVDRLLRKEVGGNEWTESIQSEIDEISKEIGGEMLNELVAEALQDLTA